MGHRPSHTDISNDLVKEKTWEGGVSGSLAVGRRWGVTGEKRGGMRIWGVGTPGARGLGNMPLTSVADFWGLPTGRL